MHIKVIHGKGSNIEGQAGLIEYVNGQVAYMLLAYNGTIDNDDTHAQCVKRFLDTAVNKHPFDLVVLNDNQVSTLYDYYKKVAMMVYLIQKK